jgi:hypothetical protein
MQPGTVILDTNALRHFAASATRERVRRSLRASDLMIWPSALNVLEILKHDNPAAQATLLDVVDALAEGRPLLPTPTDFLKQVGAAIAAGAPGVELQASGVDWCLRDRHRLKLDHRAAAKAMLDDTQQRWTGSHRAARLAIRPLLKAAGDRDPWGSIPAFLDRQWMRLEQLDTLLAGVWRSFELPEPVPYAALLADETWRLHFEGSGATVYEQAVLPQAPKPAHAADVAQLIYLSGAARRVLVTDDKGLQRVARAVLEGRHAGSRVMSTAEFLALAT